MDDKYPEILTDLREKFAELLKEELGQIAENNCNLQDLTFKLTEIIRRDWSGQGVYIPKGQAFDLSKRDYEIYQRSNGRNRHQLCREYGITEQRYYKIWNAVHQEEVRKKQGELFW